MLANGNKVRRNNLSSYLKYIDIKNRIFKIVSFMILISQKFYQVKITTQKETL